MLKKIMVLVVASISLYSVPANAGNEGAIIGGVIGGLFLGELLNNHHSHRHNDYYEEHYYSPPPPRCKVVWERVWDYEIGMYRDIPRKICRRYY